MMVDGLCKDLLVIFKGSSAYASALLAAARAFAEGIKVDLLILPLPMTPQHIVFDNTVVLTQTGS